MHICVSLLSFDGVDENPFVMPPLLLSLATPSPIEVGVYRTAPILLLRLQRFSEVVSYQRAEHLPTNFLPMVTDWSPVQLLGGGAQCPGTMQRVGVTRSVEKNHICYACFNSACFAYFAHILQCILPAHFVHVPPASMYVLGCQAQGEPRPRQGCGQTPALAAR